MLVGKGKQSLDELGRAFRRFEPDGKVFASHPAACGFSRSTMCSSMLKLPIIPTRRLLKSWRSPPRACEGLHLLRLDEPGLHLLALFEGLGERAFFARISSVLSLTSSSSRSCVCGARPLVLHPGLVLLPHRFVL